MAGKSETSNRGGVYRQIGPYLGLGAELVAPVLFCMGVWWWLDGRLATAPVLMLIGAFVGVGVGFWSFYRTVVRLQGKARDRKEKRDGRAKRRADESG